METLKVQQMKSFVSKIQNKQQDSSFAVLFAEIQNSYSSPFQSLAFHAF